jgi:hypothetical protein
MEIFFIIGLSALISLNAYAYASRKCYLDVYSSTKQRWFQIAFIWAMPFMGAALALKILRGEPEKSSGTYKEELEVGDEFTGSGRLNSRDYISALGGNSHSTSSEDTSSQD